MITLKTLKWDNCFSYGEGNEIDLSENILTQIIAPNGYGKSSIPLIIEEALFNKNSKNVKKADIPNRYKNKGYFISLEFSKDGEEYKVEVTRKTSAKVVLTKNGEDISSHKATDTFSTIKEILGIDFKFFPQIIYQNTSTSLQFLTATDTARKKFLIDLLHLEQYVELFDIFKEASKQSSTELAKIQSQIDTIERWLENNNLEDTTTLPMLEIEDSPDKDQESLGNLVAELKNIDEKNKKIQTNNQYKSMLSKVDLNEANSIKATKIESYDDLQSKAGELKSEVTQAKRMLSKMEKLGEVCPTCEQEVDPDFKAKMIEEENKKIQDATDELNNKIESRIKEIKSNNEAYRKKQKIQKEWEDLYRSIDKDLPENALDKAGLERQIQELREKITKTLAKVKATQKENEKRSQHNTRVKVVLEQREEFLNDLNKSTERLKESEKLYNNLEVLKKAFSTNGLLAYKIENLVKDLEELANSYLAEFSDGRFNLNFQVVNDKLNVVIIDNSKEVDIKALSSGELSRVNISTLLAIRKLMSSISKSKINILFLDEVISVLDDQGREKLVEILVQEKELNTYIVSHGWAHPLLSQIRIIKEDNISSLEK